MASDWIELATAAERLGLSRSAARKRCERGTLPCERRSGRLFVAVASVRPERDNAATERDTVSQQRDDAGDDDAATAIAALSDEIVYLRQVIATRDEEIRRRDHLLAGLIERLPALPETVPEPPVREAPVASNPAPGAAKTADVRHDARRPGPAFWERFVRWCRGERN
jgi:hypothetical protein